VCLAHFNQLLAQLQHLQIYVHVHIYAIQMRSSKCIYTYPSTCMPDYQHERISDFVSTESRPGLTYMFKVPRASELCNLCYKLFLSPSSHVN